MSFGIELSVKESQALAFRSRRHHLLGRGAGSPESVARAVAGIQAQVVAPALWSLAMRCAARPTAAQVVEALTLSPSLVRTWGLRGTVHIYDAVAHWPAIVTAIQTGPIGVRPGPELDDDALDAAEARIRALGRPVTRSDLFDLVPEGFLAYMTERMGSSTAAQRGAAGRFVLQLSRRGELCAHTIVDGEQSYILRQARYPKLSWQLPDGPTAGAILIRAYLSANAPASVQDTAHFFGLRVTQAKELLHHIADEVVGVECGDRPGLLAMAKDVRDLQAASPRRWPPRLLPRFDTMLMAHKDKSWTVPILNDRPRIWAKSAQVNATVLHRGKLVATWKYQKRKRAVTIELQPLSGWKDGLESQLAADADAFAAHLGVEKATITVIS